MNLTPRFSNSTMTLTVEKIVPDVERPCNPIEIILKDLEKLVDMAHEEKIKFNAWKEQVSIRIFENLNDEVNKDQAREAICFLISQVIRPMLLIHEIDFALLIILEDKLKSLLEICLPIGTDIEDAIDAYRLTLNKKRSLLKKQFLQQHYFAASFKRSMEGLKKELIPLSEHIENLLKKMQHCGHFSPEEKNEIEEWIKEIPFPQFNFLINDEKKESASLAVCYLLCDILIPVRLKPGQNDLEELAAFENELRKILALILPEGEASVEVFIEEFQVFSNEKKIFQKKLALIKESFQEKMLKINQNANVTHEKIVKIFNSFKDRLLDLSKNRNLMLQGISAKIDILIIRFDQIVIGLSDNGKDLLDVSDKMQLENDIFQKYIPECGNMFGGLKV